MQIDTFAFISKPSIMYDNCLFHYFALLPAILVTHAQKRSSAHQLRHFVFFSPLKNDHKPRDAETN